MPGKKAKINIGFKVTSKQRIKQGVGELNKQINDRLATLYEQVFGSSTRFEDWKKGKSRATKNKLQGRLFTDFNQGSAFSKKIKEMYVDGWKNKYDKIRRDYQAADPGYPENDWGKWKRKNKRRARTPHYKQRQVRYTTWGLTSGYLRESIEKGFASGGNKHLKVGNLLLQGGFSVDWDSYPKRSDGKVHYREFVEHLIRLGVLKDEDDFLEFLPGDWQAIANYMLFLIQNGFADNVDDILDSVAVKV